MALLDLSDGITLIRKMILFFESKPRVFKNVKTVTDRECFIENEFSNATAIYLKGTATVAGEENGEILNLGNFCKLKITPTDVLYEFKKLTITNTVDLTELEITDLTDRFECFTKGDYSDYTFIIETGLI